MTTLEAPAWTPGYTETFSHLQTREAVTREMCAVATPGMTELDQDTASVLTDLTERLLELEGACASEEYDRYADVKDRGLEIDRDALAERLSGKTILVTGGTGLIGAALLQELSTFSPARLVSISRGETEPQQVARGAEYMRVDIRDKDSVEAVMQAVKPDIVFHVAADKYNHEAEKRARHTLTTNIEGTKNVIDTARDAGVEQIVYASTGKATRPYSPDIYASSKKTGEFLMAEAADQGDMLCSAVRFTHVVNDSNVRRKINERIAEGLPVRLQSPDVLFYIQSAKESAHLLLNSLLEAQPDVLQVQAIRDLALPMNLLDLGLGAIAKSDARVPVYFTGVEQGYEDKAWPGLYDPMTGGDVSPLINSIEAPETEQSETCPAVDTFPLEIASTPEVNQRLGALLEACAEQNDNTILRDMNQELGWAMLDARLSKLSVRVLQRAAARAIKFTLTEELSPEHSQTGEAVQREFLSREVASL